ncbi:CbtA family protein [Rhizobium leguminosarum]|uniref:CbtA family protein n=1 Tax=Rhizobium leguminosarum TaxID=384 RepID=UPI00103BC025|nr:CbtA family protein [Rhizobium leguminosarum]TBZ57990.1 cobalt transporter subunit CbtA [Rhizobium leguminosarum bv. viciae]TCA82364.1 cobalt transporter subunit CbtA [Rhizobium leguminosarum bv. viciae]TCA92827.1 cobalt transporter subunit CbtA [Rhizobium leguminosarum bv. viciae]
MSHFQRLFFLALLAGVIGGVFASALNIVVNAPIILEAEVFQHASEHVAAGDQALHEHGESAALGRNFLTLTAMILAFVGYALLVTVVAEVSGGLQSWWSGLWWGAGGFLAVGLVPALGLPPELPGMPAADLVQRQLWWLSCAACTAVALLLIAKFQRAPAYLVSALLLAAPFLYGAPVAPDAASLVPDDLHRLFVLETLTAGFLSWLAMGVALGFLRSQKRLQSVLG